MGHGYGFYLTYDETRIGCITLDKSSGIKSYKSKHDFLVIGHLRIPLGLGIGLFTSCGNETGVGFRAPVHVYPCVCAHKKPLSLM